MTTVRKRGKGYQIDCFDPISTHFLDDIGTLVQNVHSQNFSEMIKIDYFR